MLTCHCKNPGENLGDRARQRAIQVGVVLSGVTLAVGFWALRGDHVRQLGWLVSVPAAMSCYFLLSGTFGVCAVRSVGGRRDAGYGSEVILSRQRLRQLRLRSLMTVSLSLTMGGAAAALFVASV